MKKLWNWIDCKNFASGKKYALCLWLLSLGWGLLGFVLGLGVQAVTSAGKEWLLIFHRLSHSDLPRCGAPLQRQASVPLKKPRPWQFGTRL